MKNDDEDDAASERYCKRPWEKLILKTNNIEKSQPFSY